MQEATYTNAGTAGAGDGVYTETATAAYTNPATMSHLGESKTTVNTMILDLHMDYKPTDNNGSGSAHTIMPSVGIFHVTQLNEDLHLGLMTVSAWGNNVELIKGRFLSAQRIAWVSNLDVS